MKVIDLLESRRANWSELERACARLERGPRKLRGEHVARFATLYRSACADLALADAYQLPPNTVDYLHQLVGRAHNQLYRSRTFNFSAWGYELLVAVPQRLFHDNYFRVALAVFWGIFLGTMVFAYFSPRFAEEVVGKPALDGYEESFSEPIDGKHAEASGFMTGFYGWHNPGIGLQCFAFGLLFGIGGLFVTISNAATLGTVFGHMAASKQSGNFYEFVTAHGPFELTAVVLASAAGMRLGFSIIHTQGRTRSAALRLAGREAVPTVCVSVVLFLMAALIEGFVSPSALPYSFKAAVAVASSGLMVFYFVMLGYPTGELDEQGDARWGEIP
jgi:uncharacterized membrane protein SpoIIM required for sporulation